MPPRQPDRSAGDACRMDRRWRFREWSSCSAGRYAWRRACRDAACSCGCVRLRLVLGLAIARRLVLEAEVDLAAHARARRDGDRAGLDVADDLAALQQLHALRRFDVAFQFAGHDDLARAHAAVDLGADLDGQVAFDVNIALEAAGDADMARALD